MIDDLLAYASSHLTLLLAAAIIIGIGLPLAAALTRAWGQASNEADALNDGARGEAVIEELWGTGGMAGHSPMMGMRLKARHPSGVSYTAVIEETIVPLIHAARLTPGAVVPVKIAREDRNIVALDLDSAATAPPRE